MVTILKTDQMSRIFTCNKMQHLVHDIHNMFYVLQLINLRVNSNKQNRNKSLIMIHIKKNNFYTPN